MDCSLLLMASSCAVTTGSAWDAIAALRPDPGGRPRLRATRVCGSAAKAGFREGPLRFFRAGADILPDEPLAAAVLRVVDFLTARAMQFAILKFGAHLLVRRGVFAQPHVVNFPQARYPRAYEESLITPTEIRKLSKAPMHWKAQSPAETGNGQHQLSELCRKDWLPKPGWKYQPAVERTVSLCSDFESTDRPFEVGMVAPASTLPSFTIEFTIFPR